MRLRSGGRTAARPFSNPLVSGQLRPAPKPKGSETFSENLYGGNGQGKFPGVVVQGWAQVGNYALRFEFSDGHRTGLYSYDYLRKLAGL